MKSGWLKGLGGGAYVWAHYPPFLKEALKALMTQLKLPLHIGGITRVRELRPHYSSLGSPPMFLFAPFSSKNLPRWFEEYSWKQPVFFLKTKLFDEKFVLGLKKDKEGIKVSNLERSLFEMLYELPKKHSWEEVDQLFEGLFSLDSKLLQKCFENCHSMKTKRLFLFFSQRHVHRWWEKVKTDKVSLGGGVYQLYKKGKVHPLFKISVPPFLMEESSRRQRNRILDKKFILSFDSKKKKIKE